MTKNAGEFETWLADFIDTMKGEKSANGRPLGDVPCGDCAGCCTSSKFILVRPTDTAAKEVIPKALLFSAPSLPDGFLLMGYDEQGHCPMYQNNQCSIYLQRPETCRQYDCRVLAATAAKLDDESETIATRVNEWQFQFANESSLVKHTAVARAMAFLRDQANAFPAGYVPTADSQKAAVAVRIHEVFLDEGAQQRPVDEMVTSIVEAYPI